MTYTENYGTGVQGTGTTVVKILRGTKPADIPVEQPASSLVRDMEGHLGRRTYIFGPHLCVVDMPKKARDDRQGLVHQPEGRQHHHRDDRRGYLSIPRTLSGLA